MKLTLASIKFVNGEKENPFKCKDQNKIMLWDYERGYTFTKSEKFLIDEYHCYVKNFQEKDGIPGGLQEFVPFLPSVPFLRQESPCVHHGEPFLRFRFPLRLQGYVLNFPVVIDNTK